MALRAVPTPRQRPAAEVGRVIAEHLEYMRLRGLSADTIACRRRALARLNRALSVPLLDASAADLAAWRAGLTVGPDSVIGYIGQARVFYDWAVGAGLVERNPAAGLPVPRPARRVPRPIAEADLFAAIDAAPPRVRPWLVLAAWCGLRAKEIAYLRREHVLDAARPPVLLIARDATKGRSERIVPLCAYALGELLAAGLPASGWVFRRGDGRRGPNTPARVSQVASRYLKSQAIPATLHQLRHRFGTQAYQASRDLRAVQGLLGHASPRTTAGYADYANTSAIEAVNALPTPESATGRIGTGQRRVISGDRSGGSHNGDTRDPR
jgi:integrase/recombinase XerC